MAHKLENYRNYSFSTETCNTNFYVYESVEYLCVRCEKCKEEEPLKCRTVGILESVHGKFWLADLDEASGLRSNVKLRVSLAQLPASPPSAIHPYPVQVFGTVQWKNRPVIFATILQVLSIPMAIRIKDIMHKIKARHIAANEEDSQLVVPTG